MWEYRFVPFASAAPAGTPIEKAGAYAASGFGAVVRTHAVDGWEYYRLESFPTYHPPGCLGSLFGFGGQVVIVKVAVFRRALHR